MTALLIALAVLLAFLCGLAAAFGLVAMWAAQAATEQTRQDTKVP